MANLPTTRQSTSVIGSADSDATLLGREALPDGRGGDRVQYGGELHHVLFGPNGVGKGMRVLVPNLLSIIGKSIVVIDPKGQLAAMTAKFRHQAGDDVKVIDPFGVLAEVVRARPKEYRYLIENGLVESCGFNPLAALDPDSPNFYDDAAVIADALIKVPDKEPHWAESAQGLVAGLLMWERLREGENASLEHVRYLLTEADDFESFEDRDGKWRKRQIAGLSVTADKMVREGGFEIGSLASRFADEYTNDEMASVRSTADTQTRWMLSRPMREDLKKNGVDFRKLKTGERPMTVYVVLPANFLETHSIWLRLVVSEALRANMTTGGRRVLLILDEFAALGHLSIVQKLWGVTRDYRVQMMPVFQDLPQLKSLYSERWETILGMAGVVQSFRTGDMTTAEWVSKRSPATTAVALSYNQGTGQSQGGASSNIGLSSNQISRPTILPHDMFGLPNEYTVAWLAGERNPTLLYMPHLEQLTRLKARALPNPYYQG
jgi:type IV secretion system protein VirD4